MKLTKRKQLVTGVLAGALTFVGCAPSHYVVRESPYGNNTNAGEGHISKTKQSDDNLRMPLEDPLRTKEHESIRAAEVEPNLVESDQPPVGTGGSGGTCPCPPPQECPRTPEQNPARTEQEPGFMSPESEPSVHETSPLNRDSGTGGSGFNVNDNSLNQGQDVNEQFLCIPGSPAKPVNPEDRMIDENQMPQEAH